MRQLFHPPTCSFLSPPRPASTQPESRRHHLRIVLDKATDLPVGDSILAGGASDPYLKFSFGAHRICSTVVVKSLNPSWRREQFEFVLTEDEIQTHQHLQIEVKDYDMAKSDDLLGTLAFDISAWQGATTLTDMTIQAYPIETPKVYTSQRVQPLLYVGVALLSELDATDLVVMQIWEHQRRGVTGGWHHSHLKSSDPLPWSSDHRSHVGGVSFVDAVEATPAGYKEVGPWEFKVAVGDPDGWVYAVSADGPWADQRLLTSNVRRRLWARQCRRDALEGVLCMVGEEKGGEGAP
ncbi:hypothetical protein H257_09553 [Aphanomyces astaci]|uniref:C2 domain-containing protein n=1 Tax=Aphanomyces astaci TaxID=112090 RepID=W4GBB5_APHAT|nr:hypothetical protein H257_09553 [Aphanomyces astaci]ETV76551.1 hypothetical protein H257_09553 [Aphanomyces astaci]|eukprot:XP_009834096.1 hypothetical protein H257_09553 [Aphanomyces astaci]